MTLFVTSSVAVFEAAIWVKSMYIRKSWLKTRKKYGHQRNLYLGLNIHLKDGFGMEFTQGELIPEGALASFSFTVCDSYR